MRTYISARARKAISIMVVWYRDGQFAYVSENSEPHGIRGLPGEPVLTLVTQ
jgi:hypothetical protein